MSTAPESSGISFKSWQIFIFSLIPLALVFAGVIGGSLHGSDSELEEFPAAAPAPASSPTRAPGASLPGADGAPALSLVYEGGSAVTA